MRAAGQAPCSGSTEHHHHGNQEGERLRRGWQPQQWQPCCVLRDASETASEAALPPQGTPAPQGPRLAFGSAQDVGPSPWAQALRDPPGSRILPFCVRAACSESTWTSPPHPGIWVRFQDFSTQGAREQNPKKAHSGAGHPVCRTWSIQVAGIICPYGHLGVPTVPGWASPAGTLKVGQHPAHFSSPPQSRPTTRGQSERNLLQMLLRVQRPRGPLPQQPFPPSIPCKPPGVEGGSRGGRAPYTEHRKLAQPSL